MSSEESEQIPQENSGAVVAATSTSSEEMSPELLIKHPLQNMWSLWFYKNDRSKSWEENLMEITTFDTVEDFWALYNHIEVVSKIPLGCDYALFKHGIKPMWEDSRNKQGGRWLLNVQKSQRATDLNNYWLEILLCMIGEAFDEYSDDVCGAVVQIRNKGDKLAIWTADLKHQDAIMKIGQTIKQRLNLHPRNVIGYEEWQESWDADYSNKLFNLHPTVSPIPSHPSLRLDVLLTRLRIGHSRATHRFLLAGEPPPTCPHCHEILTAHADTQIKTGSVAKCRFTL